MFSVLLCSMTGCSRDAPELADTGARAAARTFFDAIIKKDWRRAHAELATRQDSSLAAFISHAEAYRGRLGFEPVEVHIRACEERGDKAIAHVTISGRGEKQTQRYRDGIVLCRESGHWRVILPETFGKE